MANHNPPDDHNMVTMKGGCRETNLSMDKRLFFNHLAGFKRENNDLVLLLLLDCGLVIIWQHGFLIRN